LPELSHAATNRPIIAGLHVSSDSSRPPASRLDAPRESQVRASHGSSYHDGRREIGGEEQSRSTPQRRAQRPVASVRPSRRSATGPDGPAITEPENERS